MRCVRPGSTSPIGRGVRRAMTQQILEVPTSSTETMTGRLGGSGRMR